MPSFEIMDMDGNTKEFDINKNAEYGVSFDSIQQLKDEITTFLVINIFFLICKL